ncbi:hypothetical protein [Crenalkalicoccus roseus]|jgi:hypothetical protein|uniref:hypothetical protein n=1 Tax=Crenalkalicoccus roseus TaxID=1485588 RepID=UPI00108028E4|nr:hypothetical protein [Crenalkalicoccus roseus]
MEWIILALLILLGVPVLLLVLGVALAIWVTLAVAGAVWGLFTFLFDAPLIGLLLALAAGIAIGRAMARRP